MPLRARRLLAAVGTALLVSLPATIAASDVVSPAHAQALDLYYQGRLEEARLAYLNVLESVPGDHRVLLELSRTESELGEGEQGESRRRLVAAAVEHARAATAARPDVAECHLALAIALGRQAMREGPRTRLALAREVKAEVDRAIELDPGNGLAYLVRGMWNREVSSLNIFERLAAHTVLGGMPRGASMQGAVQDLKKAVDLAPTAVLHWLELGRTYSDLGRRDEAREALEKVLALPPTSGPRDVVYQGHARDLLRKLNT
jgi:tetratricopeptide (TPR) repeat protein